MAKNKTINIQGSEISIISQKEDDFISLTDMSKSQMQEAIIIKWLSLKSTIEYLGEWEALYNPVFNYTEFGTIKNAAGSNNFVLSVKQWIEITGAVGITSLAYQNLGNKRTIKWIKSLFSLNLVTGHYMAACINQIKNQFKNLIPLPIAAIG